MAEARIGVGGWNFAPWRESFYPPKLRQADELAYMASKLNAVEVNGTFYRTQTPATFRGWADATPSDFRFALKAPRYAVNRKVLAEAGESITRFVESGIAGLGEKLGPILWQFAATKRLEADDFARFLDLLPAEVDGLPLRHALEPRHDSFHDPAFPSLLEGRNIAVVLAGDSDYPLFDLPTADFAYLRIMGTTARFKNGYAPSAINSWADRIAKLGRPAWAFVISGEKRLNPAAAQALRARLQSS